MRDGLSSSSGPAVIVLFVDERGGDWHARRLALAFEARGVAVVTTCLKACGFDTSSPTGLVLPGFEGTLPSAAFVRSISDGSLEQITFRLGILHALEASGVRVWNRPRAIERSVDKSAATFCFARAGLPVPATVTVEGVAAAAAALPGIGAPAVSKPLFGAQGVGIRRVDDPLDLPAPDLVGDVYYLQSMVDGRPQRSGRDRHYEDWRILVSAGRVICAMTRRSKFWITNVHQGGEPMLHTPDPEMARLALAAAAAVGVDYGGVDLIRHEDGRLLVLEVNSNPAWRGLQSVTDIDIAARLADDVLAALAGGPSATTPTDLRAVGAVLIDGPAT